MELCAGGSLSARLGGQPLPPPEAAALVQTLARAVHAAHEAGIIHRDLKPANILLATGGQPSAHEGSESPGIRPGGSPPALTGFVPKITDFGLARRLDTDVRHTQTGVIVGTPSYMAPEQAQGKAGYIGPATDVYGLGAVLYELLTGRPPFQGETVMEILEQVVSQEPLAPRRRNPGVPRDLETVCLKCLEKEPSKRYASALELAEDLRRFLADEPTVARPVGRGERLLKWARRQPTLAAVYALLVLVLGLGACGS